MWQKSSGNWKGFYWSGDRGYVKQECRVPEWKAGHHVGLLLPDLAVHICIYDLHAPVCIYMHTKTDYKSEWKYSSLEYKTLEIREWPRAMAQEMVFLSSWCPLSWNELSEAFSLEVHWRRGASRGATVRTRLERLFVWGRVKKVRKTSCLCHTFLQMRLFHVHGSRWFAGVSGTVSAGSEMRRQYFSLVLSEAKQHQNTEVDRNNFNT